MYGIVTKQSNISPRKSRYDNDGASGPSPTGGLIPFHSHWFEEGDLKENVENIIMDADATPNSKNYLALPSIITKVNANGELMATQQSIISLQSAMAPENNGNN